MGVSVFLPCRAGSKRVPAKNTTPFTHGISLLEIKLKQLVALDVIDEIIVSTDDPKVVEIASAFSEVTLIKRANELCSDSTSIEDLCKHAHDVTTSDLVLWTHVTSPFFGVADYNEALSAFLSSREDYDSLVSVNAVKGFLLDERGSLVNGKKSLGSRWPATQALTPHFAVNSAVFITPRSLLAQGKRMGQKPYFHETHLLKSVDIDTHEDWDLGQSLARSTLFDSVNLRLQE